MSGNAERENAKGKKSPELCRFERLYDSETRGLPRVSSIEWDRRADEWAKDNAVPEKEKSGDRIADTLGYLRGKGLLGAACDAADVGCGSGRFAAAFAGTARYVLALDVSERMIYHAAEYARRENLKNLEFRVCDFQSLDVGKENLAGKFDLVFSSLTSAVNGVSGLEKVIRMSRGHCCNVAHIHSENEMESRIMREVFGRERPMLWATHQFYSAFNLLFLRGYYPEATYYKRHREQKVSPCAERARLFAEHMLPQEERTPKNEERVLNWMRSNADSDGYCAEISDIWYGRLLWDVRERTKRPDYALTPRP